MTTSNGTRDSIAGDRTWIRNLLRASWGDTILIVRGEVVDAAALSALVVESTGLLTYRRIGRLVEIVSLNAIVPNQGIGSALIDALATRCAGWGTEAIIVMTTNDNLDALGFYQRRGFVLDALFPDAMAAARLVKPSIPMIAANRVPVRDEIRLRRAIGK